MHEFDWRPVWDDQLQFQRELEGQLKLGHSYPEIGFDTRTARTKEMVLHLFSEADELLRAAGAWKYHRNLPVMENREHVKIELIDMLKYWLIIAHVHGFTAEEMIEAYWTKSMVVRQRMSEEWVRDLNRLSAIIDIDNVIADYIGGFLSWAASEGHVTKEAYESHLKKPRSYLRFEELGLSLKDASHIHHLFRVSTQHRYLPLMAGAKTFLKWVRDQGLQIVLLTARPIHKYPNLYGDTLRWLTLHDLPYDIIWWAQDKGDAVRDRLPSSSIVFAIDDEAKYVDQLTAQGIMTFWFRPTDPDPVWEKGIVSRLADVPQLYETYGERHVVSGFGPSATRTPHRGDTGE